MATEPIHQVANGRWELRYRDPSGRPRRMRFATKREARDFSSDLRVRSQLGTWTSPETGRLTLERWVNEWWATVVHLHPATKVRYERDVRLHVLPRFGVTQLARISPRRQSLGSRDDGGRESSFGCSPTVLRAPEDPG